MCVEPGRSVDSWHKASIDENSVEVRCGLILLKNSKIRIVGFLANSGSFAETVLQCRLRALCQSLTAKAGF